MPKPHYCDRRRFIGTAATAIAGAGLLASRSGEDEPRSRDADGPINKADARRANVRYGDGGPRNGPSVILMDGATDGIDADAAQLAARGYRVIVPHVAGAAASDVIALMAALEIEKAVVSGRGESARTAEVLAALWPQRLKAVGPINGSGVVVLAATQRPLPPNEELAWWHQYYFNRKGDA